MDFPQLLQNLMQFIYDNLFNPIFNFMGDNALSAQGFLTMPFQIGFGDIIWFTTTPQDLICFAIAIGISITALVLTIKFIKTITNFVKGLFGGVK